MSADAMTEFCVALGGNQGDLVTTFDRAVRQLAETPGIELESHSRWAETAAVGANAGTAYLNGAVLGRTALGPLELLDRLQEIEHQNGRVRTIHWGPRTLDLDLIFYGSEQRHTLRLTIPHPDSWYRRFVLDPVCEIAGDRMHPERGCSWQALQSALLPRPLPVVLSADLLSSSGSSERDRLGLEDIVRLQNRFSSARI